MCVVDHTCNPSTLEVEEGWLEIEEVPIEVTATHKSREAKGGFLLIYTCYSCVIVGKKKKKPNRNTLTEEIILVCSFREITAPTPPHPHPIIGPTLLGRASWLQGYVVNKEAAHLMKGGNQRRNTVRSQSRR